MPKKDPISDEDKSLFRDSVKGVKRMGQSNTVSTQSAKRTPKTRVTIHPELEEPDQPDWSDGTECDWVNADTELNYKKSGVNERTIRELRTGKFSIDASLDLHGHTVDAARQTLNQFINRHSVAQRRCVCIIHGKGLRGGNYPVLKSKINVWLKQSDKVVAFASAPKKQGGTGALLVLLN